MILVFGFVFPCADVGYAMTPTPQDTHTNTLRVSYQACKVLFFQC